MGGAGGAGVANQEAREGIVRTVERAWHLRIWLVIGPLCVGAVVWTVLTRPRSTSPTGWAEGTDAPVQRDETGVVVPHARP